MKVLKLNSRGSEVEQLQRLLRMKNADGIFGQKTLEAVQAFQRKYGLVPDGVIGERTWSKLLAENSGGLNIVKGYISKHITYSPNRPVEYIAIHYTAGSTSREGSAFNTKNVFLSRPASADFVVDDAQIVQVNPDLRNYYCWAVGDKKNAYSGGGRLYGIATNRNTVSIEICSNLRKGASAAYANNGGWYFTEASIVNAVELVRYLMRRFGIPKQKVVRHYDISGKLCPGILGWNDAPEYDNGGKLTGLKSDSIQWEMFLNRI